MTQIRHVQTSNCLERFKVAHGIPVNVKVSSLTVAPLIAFISFHLNANNCPACPLWRGDVIGWFVIYEACLHLLLKTVTPISTVYPLVFVFLDKYGIGTKDRMSNSKTGRKRFGLYSDHFLYFPFFIGISYFTNSVYTVFTTMCVAMTMNLLNFLSVGL